eukprot:GHVU01174190.1.p2 GENE.GHVU01174190.1~~GHVU01174190.1.p2  ORF type:complete len:130 (+),score=5.77 GHVU01174190.1:285-674(+)
MIVRAHQIPLKHPRGGLLSQGGLRHWLGQLWASARFAGSTVSQRFPGEACGGGEKDSSQLLPPPGPTTTDAQVGCRPKLLLKAVRSICCDSLGAYLFVRLPAAFSPGLAATSVNADELDLAASSGVCPE